MKKNELETEKLEDKNGRKTGAKAAKKLRQTDKEKKTQKEEIGDRKTGDKSGNKAFTRPMVSKSCEFCGILLKRERETKTKQMKKKGTKRANWRQKNQETRMEENQEARM